MLLPYRDAARRWLVAGWALTTTITMTNILTGCLTNYMATDLRVAQQVFELFVVEFHVTYPHQKFTGSIVSDEIENSTD